MGRLAVRILPVLGLALLLLAWPASSLHAHGFGERYDLPVPLGLYVAGSGAAVALSFVVIGLFVRGAPGLRDYPRLNLLRWAGQGPAGLTLAAAALVARVLAVAVFVLVLAAGLFGDQAPTNNLAPTVVWVVWWVGLAYASALVGDVWAVVNPWKTLFEWAEALYRRLRPGSELSLRRPYPAQWGAWPGVALFAAYAWAELVYADAAVPVRIAQMGLAYSAITWAGMFVFGKEVWLRNGEAFSLAFGFLARFAPTEIRVTDTATCEACPVDCEDRDGRCIGCGDCYRRAPQGRREVCLRPFAAGLLRHEAVSTSMMVFVVLLLATVTFDGLTATPAWVEVSGFIADVVSGSTAVGTVGLVAVPLLFLGVYLGVCALMAAASGRGPSVEELARAFVYSLIPIALAYHLAHFLSFLLVQGQAIIPLASDPFGSGWDLLGTADYTIDIGVVGARFAWFTAVIGIVVGHIIAVYLAHAVALRTLGDRGAALRSQYPMLALMVGYTMLSLWILAQPIVEAGG